jgi:ABC-type sugar transport system ATPase subunit
MNFIPGTVADARFELGNGGTVDLPPRFADAAGGVTLGIRPEHLVVNDDAPILSGTVQVHEYLGERSYLHVELGEGTQVIATTAAAPPSGKIGMSFDPAQIHLFDRAGQALGF